MNKIFFCCYSVKLLLSFLSIRAISGTMYSKPVIIVKQTPTGFVNLRTLHVALLYIIPCMCTCLPGPVLTRRDLPK